MDFAGAKLVLLIGGRLLTLLRDERSDIVYPGHWDMPGGAREGAESPEACILRETREEFGLVLAAEQLVWRGDFDSPTTPGLRAWWFAARLPAAAERAIVFGEEGQRWALMAPADWLAEPLAIPHFRDRVRAGLAALGEGPFCA
ncbi:NUDIX hydrolase [Sinisalibacter aestuarii]|uniref:DNA mismatch repair protein MutT n=1 Tax=Sinisalibacter aestuarii TaxID=2949426 RepID=A0ABQ5LP78_9RHOB|nr:NUDIX hydrolase [Sinisalibacter aestuarii]GKY86810.1 DNA mismatch repair protein MutT [Sinisalibacter aestuarii]